MICWGIFLVLQHRALTYSRMDSERPIAVSETSRVQNVSLLTDKEILKELAGDQRDFSILNEIVFCESSWSHFWSDGSVKVSNGNVGYFQINATVWAEHFDNLGVDIYNPTDNIRAGVILFNEQGIRPWDKWSGHCFRPRLKNQGIDL